MTQIIVLYGLQLGSSSRAKHGGAYFSAVFGLLFTSICDTEQILVNKSDKSDHTHQREAWCFVEVVNEVGAGAMPTPQ